ncbi:GlxA family transcriptional regulator [Roseinatronobacter sp. S2]|uniref:GlxA family transcriptional regulator n=1 Tax=Roseinatronobacter sp. S2 TaxID=3035471 RepID=UPI00240EFDD3|nr:GlxA family transcriptional regulator [Roseinatronobacter sp. S2]WFE75786.1 GlxA family transcriptional regulator [Roseinatronobacter sp. S2]WFE75838.1 GlxA family transcriptional regulator [Roseinatronobacter sp. S2]
MALSIDILAFEGCQVLDVTGPLQVFATANDLAALDGRPTPYRARVIAPAPMITTSSGLSISAAPLSAVDVPPDTLIVAGGQGTEAACRDAALIKEIRTRAAVVRRLASVCSGAFLLATAGLLDGRRAATHWQRGPEFSARFPQVRLDLEPIFIRDGAIWTSAGVTAGIDLCLALVEDDLGHATALAVARQLVVFLKRPGDQAQFSAPLERQSQSGPFAALHGWMAGNLHRPLTLEILAERAGMSTRSFSRHYRRITGQTPQAAIKAMRCDLARDLLDRRLSVSEVARRSGIGSPETLRRAFLNAYGQTPLAYQRQFASNRTG